MRKTGLKIGGCIYRKDDFKQGDDMYYSEWFVYQLTPCSTLIDCPQVACKNTLSYLCGRNKYPLSLSWK